MGIVVLVSGGIDSLVMSKIIEEQGQKMFPLFVDYGQLAAEKEWEACKKLFSDHQKQQPKKINLSGYGKFFPSGITDANKKIIMRFLDM